MRMTLEVGGDSQVGFRFYSLIKKFAKPSGIKIDTQTGEKLKSYTRRICNDTDIELKANDIGNCIVV